MNLMYEGKNKVTTIASTVPDMRVLIELGAYKKMYYIVEECDKEVGWLGVVEKNENVFLIKDVFLFKQQTSATTCEITPEGIADMIDELIQKPNGDYIVSNLSLWGHSHVNMGTTPSIQDEKQLLSFKENGNDWFLGVICNKQGSLNFTYIDYAKGIIVSDLKWKVLIPNFDDEKLRLDVKNELKEKVSNMPIVASYKSPFTKNTSIPGVQVVKYNNGYKVDNYQEDYFDKFFDDYSHNYNSHDSVDNFEAFDKVDKEAMKEAIDFGECFEFFEEAWFSDVEYYTQDFYEFSKGMVGKGMSLKNLDFIFKYLTPVDYINIYTDYIEERSQILDEKVDSKKIKTMGAFYTKLYLQDNFCDVIKTSSIWSKASKDGEMSFGDKIDKLCGRFILDYVYNNNICEEYIQYFFDSNGYDPKDHIREYK